MQDRVPVNPGRVLIAPENGATPYYATMTRADNPTQEGTALNKATLLKDATAAKFGLGADAVPDDVFGVLSRFQSGLGNEYLWAKYRNTQLPKIVESTSVSKVAMFLRVGESTFTVQYADSVKMSGDSVVLVNPTTISGSVSKYASSYAAQTVGKYVVSAENGKVYKIAGAEAERYGDYIGQTGYLVSVEYETVSTVVGYVNSPNSNAYPVDDGYTYQALGQLGAKAQVATGSYTGTGTYGKSNPNSLTFDFEPKLLIVKRESESYSMEWMVAVYGQTQTSTFHATTSSSGAQCTMTWSGRTVSWYANSNNYTTADAPGQLNDAAAYRYVAIG